ncbi:unnamed protein product [Heterobilharzia americana]|nr:unnamed protein product [Heterobilharzia americana]
MSQILRSNVSLVRVRPRNPSTSSSIENTNDYYNFNVNKTELQNTSMPDNNETEDRTKWSSRINFLLSSISFAVDLSTVFRFPYLCYIHGGGAFLIAYLVMLIFCTVPLFYMELVAGQYFRQGCVSMWKIALLFKGVGWTSCVLTFFASLYYNVIIAWAFFYLFATFQKELPWENSATSAREFFEL